MYLIMYVSLLYVTLKENEIREKLNNNYNLLQIMTVILAVLAAVRFYVGTDYETYVHIFNGINSITDYSYLEIGFRMLIVFVKIFTVSPTGMFLAMSFISMAFLYKGIEKISKKPMWSLYIFFCVFYIGYIFNAIRQGFTMCVFLYALQYFEQKDYKRIFLCILIACSIHSSGIYILLAYAVYNLNLEKKYYIYIVAVGIILCLFNPLQQILMNISIFDIGEKVRIYSQYEGDKLDIISMAQRIILISVMLYNFKYMSVKDKKIFNVYMLGWVAYSVFSFQAVVATRINMFFRILEIILLPNILVNIDDKKKKKYLFIFIMLWISVILLVDLRNSANFPFRFVGINY